MEEKVVKSLIENMKFKCKNVTFLETSSYIEK